MFIILTRRHAEMERKVPQGVRERISAIHRKYRASNEQDLRFPTLVYYQQE